MLIMVTASDGKHQRSHPLFSQSIMGARKLVDTAHSENVQKESPHLWSEKGAAHLLFKRYNRLRCDQKEHATLQDGG